MDYQEFEKLLKKIGINKKEFSTLTELSYQTIMNWNNTNNVPKWVKSWLKNYIEAKSYSEIKEKVLKVESLKSKSEPFELMKETLGLKDEDIKYK